MNWKLVTKKEIYNYQEYDSQEELMLWIVLSWSEALKKTVEVYVVHL